MGKRWLWQKRQQRGASAPVLAVRPRLQSRHIIGALVAVSVVVAVATLYVWVDVKNRMAIGKVEIIGHRDFLSDKKVQAALSDYISGDFFNLDIESARSHLLALPWIREVALHRAWPDKLVIELREQRALARWYDSEHGRVWLNERAELFAETAIPPDPNVPELSGPAGKHVRVYKTYLQLLEKLTPVELSVAGLELDTRDTWKLRLEGNTVVSFLEKNKDLALTRLLVALTVFDKATFSRIERIDFRYSHGFAVAWKGANTDV